MESDTVKLAGNRHHGVVPAAMLAVYHPSRWLFERGTAMAEPHVIGALRNKRAELAGIVLSLKQQLVQRRASLTHLDATMRLFDPELRPEEIRPRRQRTCNAWFRPGECLRLVYDVLRDAAEPVRAPDLVARIMAMKSISASDARQ
jgi:hypothetical protein